MSRFAWTLLIVFVVAVIYYIYSATKDPSLVSNRYSQTSTYNPGGSSDTPNTSMPTESPVTVTPIMHATVLLKWQDKVIYTDPTSGAEAFEGQTSPDLILLTDIHGDHYSPETLTNILSDAKIVAPQAVYDMMPQNLKDATEVLANGETKNFEGFNITGVPMYNVPEAADASHIKGRGNGYIIEKDNYRVYVAGDTGPTDEMKSLKNINMAFVPMNLPYTMSVEDAASAVLAFKPQVVYPYHYRQQEGLADVNKFKELVDFGSENIEVVLLNWYPE